MACPHWQQIVAEIGNKLLPIVASGQCGQAFTFRDSRLANTHQDSK